MGSCLPLDEAVLIIDRWVEEGSKQCVCVAPVSTIVSCQENNAYKEVVNNASMVTPDGMPIVWLGKRAGHRHVGRTYGPDLMREVCNRGQSRGYKHYLLGGTEDTSQKLEMALKRDYPQINIVGRFVPPFQDTFTEDIQLIDQINEADPDIVWVGLGAPKQDFWISQYRDKIHAPIMVGVGAAFDYVSGVKPQAPPWMQRSGLEWFFRLCSEPRRLWKRYLVGNTKFLWLLAKSSLKGK